MPDDAQFETMTPQDLGLPPGVRVPLRFTPARTWSPLVISFPHVGLAWPHDLRPKPQADYARNSDYEVQTLYRDAASLGVATVEAIYSRLVVDLNRAEDDVSPVLVPDHPAPRPRRRPGVPSDIHDPDHGHSLDRPGRGVVWAAAVGGGRGGAVRILDKPLSFDDFQRRIEHYHRPYYRALELLLKRRRDRFGYAVLLDAHSMPSSVGVELVLGTLGGSSCAPVLENSALGAIRGEGPDHEMLQVQINEPYRGGEVIRRFGKPSESLHALQLEVNRALYMDERTHTLWAHPDVDAVVEGGQMRTTLAAPSGWADGPGGREPASRGPGEPRSGSFRHDPLGGRDAEFPRTGFTRPSGRQARDLAELMRRLRRLIRTLSSVNGELQPIRGPSGGAHADRGPR